MSLKSFVLNCLPDSWVRTIRHVHYLRALRRSYDQQEPDLIVAKALAGSGTCALDVGANIGVYTKALAEAVGPHGLVMSVEPIPHTFEVLSYCVKKLGLSNVKAHNCAVSDKSGTMSMFVPQYQKGEGEGFNFYQAKLMVESAGGASSALQSERQYHGIMVRTLDDIVKDVAMPISFMKCDVEGHELPAMVGSRALLMRWGPALLIEVAGNPEAPDTSAAKLFAYLKEMGYGVWMFSEGRLRCWRAGDKWLNYFFLKDTHLTRVAHLMES